MKLKGFTQLIAMNEAYDVRAEDAHRIWVWSIENDDSFYLHVKDKTVNKQVQSGWEATDIPGRTHESYSNFVLWFEYDD